MLFFSEMTCQFGSVISFSLSLLKSQIQVHIYLLNKVIIEKLHWKDMLSNWFVGPWHLSQFWEQFSLLNNTDIKLQSENLVNGIY